MRSDVAGDLSDSAYDFERVVWPVIADACGDGELVSVEGAPDDMIANSLDMLAGIDAWQLQAENGRMRGIASRVQWCAKSWDTFTLRLTRSSGARTEVSKRIEALRSAGQWLLPSLTTQAYITLPRRSGELIRAAVCDTRDLYDYVDVKQREDPEWEKRHTRMNPADGNLFLWVHWVDYQRAKLKLVIRPKKKT